MRNRAGFTVIEVIVVVLFAIVAAGLFFSQQLALQAANRDDSRKIAINAVYYNLEEVFYQQLEYYPQNIDSKTLRAMDPALFTDPNGYKLGDKESDYTYEAKNCDLDGKCQGYRLSAAMESEAEYVKTNRR